jgi:hypothetical protein
MKRNALKNLVELIAEGKIVALNGANAELPTDERPSPLVAAFLIPPELDMTMSRRVPEVYPDHVRPAVVVVDALTDMDRFYAVLNRSTGSAAIAETLQEILDDDGDGKLSRRPE